MYNFFKKPSTWLDFEIFFLDPQLHQIFKPIRKFFCTFLHIQQFNLKTPYKQIKVSKNQRPTICFIISFHDFISSFHSQPAGRGSRAMVVTGLEPSGFSNTRLRHRTCKTRHFQRLWHRTCKTRHFQRLWHRTCKTRHFQWFWH